MSLSPTGLLIQSSQIIKQGAEAVCDHFATDPETSFSSSSSLESLRMLSTSVTIENSWFGWKRKLRNGADTASTHPRQTSVREELPTPDAQRFVNEGARRGRGACFDEMQEVCDTFSSCVSPSAAKAEKGRTVPFYVSLIMPYIGPA